MQYNKTILEVDFLSINRLKIHLNHVTFIRNLLFIVSISRITFSLLIRYAQCDKGIHELLKISYMHLNMYVCIQNHIMDGINVFLHRKISLTDLFSSLTPYLPFLKSVAQFQMVKHEGLSS